MRCLGRLNMAVGPLAQIERLDMCQHRVQTGKQREQDATPALLVAAALPVGFEEAREKPANRAMHVKTLAGQHHAAGGRVGIAVEAADHTADIRIDVMIDMAGEAPTLAGQRNTRMDFTSTPDLCPL